MSYTFNSVSAPAGSGKTFALAAHAADLARNHRKVMIVQPTKALIQETWQAILRNDPSLQVKPIISASLGTSRVMSDVMDHLQKADPAKGEVLLISHDILERLPNTHRQFWNLFVDEMPGGFDAFDLKIAVTHEHVTAHLKAEEPLINDIVVVEAQNEGSLRDLSENKNEDAGLEVFHDLAASVLDPNKLVCVNKDNYARLIDPTGAEKVTSFFSILKPSFLDGFASVTIMGANLNETELYLLWEKLLEVNWKKHPGLSAKLRYDEHVNGERLTIKYLIDGNWSKYHASLPLGRKTILDGVSIAMERALGDDFLWQANKSVPDSQFEDGIRLPTKAHGQNKPKFMRCDNVALVMAVNHAKPASDFLKQIGFGQDEIKIILQYQNEYQALMRCSLRDPKATTPVTVCVVSKGSADWLEKRFPGCKVEKLAAGIPEPGTVGRPATGNRLSDADKQKAYREREKLKKAEAALAAEEQRKAAIARMRGAHKN